jgi:hypothetical protein
MFREYIPKAKFVQYKTEVSNQENLLDRPLTKFERIKIVRNTQNFYGEMNESLFGRTGTVTSLMRFFANAPGYAEGDARNTGNAIATAIKIAGKGFKGDYQGAKEAYAEGHKSISHVIWSMVSVAILAQVASRIFTGKWKKKPTGFNNTIRDQFKIDTNATDGRGNEIMYDLLTYEKDPYMIFGNLLQKEPGQIAPDLFTRVQGLASSPFKWAVDLGIILTGGNVVDFKNDPIFARTDSQQDKISKFLVYEATKGNPISIDVFNQALTKGVPPLEAFVLSVAGFRGTNSEHIKDVIKTTFDVIDMENVAKQKASEISKLMSENPAEAAKQKAAFNKQQLDKLDAMLKAVGETPTAYQKVKVQVMKVYPYSPMEGGTVTGLLKH